MATALPPSTMSPERGQSRSLGHPVEQRVEGRGAVRRARPDTGSSPRRYPPTAGRLRGAAPTITWWLNTIFGPVKGICDRRDIGREAFTGPGVERHRALPGRAVEQGGPPPAVPCDSGSVEPGLLSQPAAGVVGGQRGAADVGHLGHRRHRVQPDIVGMRGDDHSAPPLHSRPAGRHWRRMRWSRSPGPGPGRHARAQGLRR